MTDETQATETTSHAEPAVSEIAPTPVETPAPEPQVKKPARSAKPKTEKPKTARAPRAKKAVKSEEAAAPVPEEIKPAAKARKPAARAAKPAKAVKPAKAAKPAKPAAKSAKPAAAAKTVKPAKAKAPVKTAAKAPAKTSVKTAPVKAAASKAKLAPKAKAAPAKIAPAKNARYTTNELNAAAKKAGLLVDFTPVVTKSASIGRGPARDFKVDAIIAHLRGSNGDLIRDRGPGTPLYNDKESLAAVEIFEKFRGRTFHNKVKVELL